MADCGDCGCHDPELKKIRLRTLLWAVVPAAVVFLVPQEVRRLAGEMAPAPQGWSRWAGGWLVLNGLGLVAWCAQLLNVEGRGTPMPLDPTKELVATGPYRHVRNPMLLGLFLTLLGETVWFRSWAMWIYTLLIATVAHLWVVKREERDLAKRFGSRYDTYRRRVPRWIPSMKPVSKP